MNAPSESAPHRKRRWPRILLAVVLVLVVGYAAVRYLLHRRVEAKMDAIREDGLPVTLGDLEKWYPEPTGGNAAPIYWEAFGKYTQSVYLASLDTEGRIRLSPPGPPGRGARFASSPPPPPVRYEEFPRHGEPLSDEARRIMEDWIGQNLVTLQRLHQAAAIRGCRFPVDLDDGVNTGLPHLWKLRECARLLEVEALVNAEHKDVAGTIRSVTSSLAICRSLLNEPFPTSQSVRSICTHTAAETLQSVMCRVQFDQSQLKRLTEAWAEVESTDSLFRTMLCERARISHAFSEAPLMIFDDFESGSLEPKWLLAFGLYRSLGLVEVEHLWSLDYTGKVADVMQQPYPQRLKLAAEVDAKYNQGSRLKMLAHLYEKCGAWPRAAQRARFESTCVASSRNAGTALAIECWQLEKGSLPMTLSDLVPSYLESVPTDPFDGKAIRYKKLSKGYVVYSVGLDGIDDGGLGNDSTRKAAGLQRDITFTVER